MIAAKTASLDLYRRAWIPEQSFEIKTKFLALADKAARTVAVLGEALDLTTPSGRALAGMLAVFAEFERDILRDRVKAGIAQARKEGRPHGRPPSIARHAAEVKRLSREGTSKREIAKRMGISRATWRARCRASVLILMISSWVFGGCPLSDLADRRTSKRALNIDEPRSDYKTMDVDALLGISTIQQPGARDFRDPVT